MKKIIALFVALIMMGCSVNYVYASAPCDLDKYLTDDIFFEEGELDEPSPTLKCSDKLSVVHTQEDGFTFTTAVDSTVSIPLRVLYGGDYDHMEISISSSDNIEIVSTPYIVRENDNTNNTLEYDFSTQINIISKDNDVPRKINDVGLINVSCSITKDFTTTLTTSLLLNVLVSPEAIVISELGIDTIELSYYKWLKAEALISDEEYEAFLDSYHGVDFIIDGDSTECKLRETATSRFSEVINSQHLQVVDTPDISVLAYGNETASTTTASESSVYVEYTITVQNSGETLHIFGNVIWKDTNDDEHPVKNARVEIVDDDVVINDVLATRYTDDFGFFQLLLTIKPNGTKAVAIYFFKYTPATQT